MTSTFRKKTDSSSGCAIRSTIPALVMATAVVAGAGSLLLAGSARAAITACDFGGYVGIYTPCSVGTVLQDGSQKVTLLDLPDAGQLGTIKFQNTLLPLSTLVVNFDPLLLPAVSGATLKYEIETSPGYSFTGVKLDSNNSGLLSTKVVKSELLGPGFFGTLTSDNGIPDPAPPAYAVVPGGQIKLIVLDTYDVTNDVPGQPAPGTLEGFTNSFLQAQNVPGPLPLMGAGMAFGFSRKLRGRIKSRASAKV